MSSPPPSPDASPGLPAPVGGAAPLSDAEAADVLRYWLGSMRYQEALAARPKAQRPEPQDESAIEPAPNLAQPVAGRKYMKLGWSGREAFVAAQRGQLELELVGEARSLFEDWLVGSYRRGEDDDEAQRVGYLLSFPTLLLPRGELASILRCPVEARWLGDGGEFVPPRAADRAQSKYPPPPSRLALRHATREADDALPYFIDSRLLADILRLDMERLDAFFADLRRRTPRPRAVLSAVTRLIAAQIEQDGPAPHVSTAAPSGSASARLLHELCAVVTRRLAQLGSRARAYPLALLVNGDQSRVTAHAQRDLEATIERLEQKSLKRDAPLSRYVRGLASEQTGAAPLRSLGRFTPVGLTPHQRDALELCLGRRLCAIQGPPGTGKTTLILNRVADALVRKVLPLASGHAMSDAVVVVTSTNNAAVDNVTSALSSALGADSLPLSLRAGSREVIERVTSADLEQSLAWLERRREPPSGELEASAAELARAVDAVQKWRPGPSSPDGELEGLCHAAFACAVRTRESWAARNRGNLLNVLALALRATKSARTLASVLGNTNKGGAWLRRLFPAFGCTLLSLGNVFPAEPDCLEQVIIDEAGQCHPGYAVSALLRGRTALIIGDVHQLEPVIGLSREDERRVIDRLRLSIAAERLAPYRTHDESGVSAQLLADRAVPDRPTLTDHFRCQAPIAAICEQLCAYGLCVRTPPSSRLDRAPRLGGPVAFVGPAGDQERRAGSWMNAGEAREVVAWVQYLLACGIPADEIGVITPFRGQLELLSHELARGGIPLAEARGGADSPNLDLFAAPTRGLSLGTVHRFQGGERSIILLSTTVTRAASLRFVDERVNLVNVAASRARDHLLTVGHEATLSTGRHTRALLTDALRLQPLSTG